MIADLLLRRAAAWLLLLMGWGVAASAQEPRLLATEVAVARDEAALRLELSSGEPLEVVVAAGRVRLGDEDLGASTPELDAAWRALLSEVVTLEDGPLLQALLEWSPPETLEGDELRIAEAIDAAFESTLAAPAAAPAPPSAAPDADAGRRALLELMDRPDRLSELAAALGASRPSGEIRVYVGESGEIASGTTVGTAIVVDGDLAVRGEVEGDVIVVGGTVRLEPGGRVGGDVRTVDARLYRDGGELEGRVRDVEAGEARENAEVIEERIREEILREIRSEMGGEDGFAAPFVGRIFSPFRWVLRGVAGLFSTLLTAGVLSLIGAAVLHFAPNNLEVVAESARRSPGRAAAVGLAGVFLTLPVWVLGAALLAISIIGIPVAVLWLPLFPLAVALSAVLGYYAVARNVGAWIARQRYPWLGWVRLSNPLTLIAGGVLALLGAFAVSNVLTMAGPWLGFLQGLFIAGGVVVTVWAVLTGFGAVLITRAGRRPEYYTGLEAFDAAFEEELADAAPRGEGGTP